MASVAPAFFQLVRLFMLGRVATMSGSSSAAAAASGSAIGPPLGPQGEYLFIRYDALVGGRMDKKEPAQKTVMKLVNDRSRLGSQQLFTWPLKGFEVTEPPTFCFD